MGQCGKAPREEVVGSVRAGIWPPGPRQTESSDGSADAVRRRIGEVVGEEGFRAGDPVGHDDEALGENLHLDRDGRAHPVAKKLIGSRVCGHGVDDLVAGGPPEVVLPGQSTSQLLDVALRRVRPVMAPDDGCNVAGAPTCPW